MAYEKRELASYQVALPSSASPEERHDRDGARPEVATVVAEALRAGPLLVAEGLYEAARRGRRRGLECPGLLESPRIDEVWTSDDAVPIGEDLSDGDRKQLELLDALEELAEPSVVPLAHCKIRAYGLRGAALSELVYQLWTEYHPDPDAEESDDRELTEEEKDAAAAFIEELCLNEEKSGKK